MPSFGLTYRSSNMVCIHYLPAHGTNADRLHGASYISTSWKCLAAPVPPVDVVPRPADILRHVRKITTSEESGKITTSSFSLVSVPRSREEGKPRSLSAPRFLSVSEGNNTLEMSRRGRHAACTFISAGRSSSWHAGIKHRFYRG